MAEAEPMQIPHKVLFTKNTKILGSCPRSSPLGFLLRFILWKGSDNEGEINWEQG